MKWIDVIFLRRNTAASHLKWTDLGSWTAEFRDGYEKYHKVDFKHLGFCTAIFSLEDIKKAICHRNYFKKAKLINIPFYKQLVIMRRKNPTQFTH